MVFFKMGCLIIFSKVNCWYSRPFIQVISCSNGPIWFASLEVDLSMLVV
jgi:hypothetical protein